jgi:hypothetical protein
MHQELSSKQRSAAHQLDNRQLSQSFLQSALLSITLTDASVRLLIFSRSLSDCSREGGVMSGQNCFLGMFCVTFLINLQKMGGWWWCWWCGQPRPPLLATAQYRGRTATATATKGPRNGPKRRVPRFWGDLGFQLKDLNADQPGQPPCCHALSCGSRPAQVVASAPVARPRFARANLRSAALLRAFRFACCCVCCFLLLLLLRLLLFAPRGSRRPHRRGRSAGAQRRGLLASPLFGRPALLH